MIVIIDYGMGNLGSIYNMLKKLGRPSLISADKDIINNASKLILPGVGSFDNAMKNLNELGITSLLEKKVFENQTPILGICLGMQLLGKRSEEGQLPGLGWIDARTVKFKGIDSMKIPHMGWNFIDIRSDSLLFNDLPENPKYYFVHSYHMQCEREEDILAQTEYGYSFVCAVQKKNIYGTQFHPEKSHKYGLKLIDNFVRLT